MLLLLGSLAASPAQDTATTRYFCRVWRTDNGLPDNAVTAVVQTRDGYLWVGTYGGLARFDGMRFKVFNSANTPELQSDRITSLYEDQTGKLWIGHEHGDVTSMLDGNFTAQQARETGVRRKAAALGADTSGDVWMLNEEGTMLRIRDSTICALPNQDGVVLMAHGAGEKIWVTSSGHLASLEQSRLAPADGWPGDYVQGITSAQDGGIWVVSDDLVRRWTGRAWNADRGTNPCASAITAMLETRSGCLAMGTLADGLYLLFPDRTLLHLNHSNGFPHDWVRCLYEDQEGTIWAGAGSGGLVAVRPGKVETVNPPDNFRERVALSVCSASDGSVWVGTEGAGLYQLLNGAWRQFDGSAGLSNQFVWCVSQDPEGHIWAGTWGGGVFRQEGDHFVIPRGLENVTVPTPALLHSQISSNTWIGTANGLVRYGHGTISWIDTREGLEVPDVRAIVEASDGTIWFGMLGDGLGRLQNGVLKRFHKVDGLASDYVQCLHLETNGVLWIGTYGSGLCRYKDGHFATITSASGLPNNFICSLEDDDHNNLWVGSHGGVFRVSKKSLDNCADNPNLTLTSLVCGKSDGMPSLECSGGLQPASARTPDGRLWFPTSKGLAVIDPNHTKFIRQPPPVLIEEIWANGRQLNLPLHSPAPLRISQDLQRLEFRYTGLSFVSPEKVRFQYWLDGWENTWVDADGRRSVEYSYLPPGNYTFRVRACNSDGVWNQLGDALAFTVPPWFWQTLWFRTLAIILGLTLAATIAWFIARSRMHHKLEAARRLQAIERERTRIAKDIHDHLGANLTRISLLSQSAQGELKNTIMATIQLERIYDTARELTRALDEIVWAVNPQHDSLDSLGSYFGNFAQEYLGSINIRCRLEVPIQLPHWPITAELRHNLFLAFKEALHNLVKHSRATEVCVQLIPNDTGFDLLVRDNGQGFDIGSTVPRPGHGNGLKNMHQRLEKMGGRFEIRTRPGEGTEILFSVNLPH